MEIAQHRLYTFDLDTAASLLSFLWTPATAEMTDDEFKEALRAFGAEAVWHGARRCLIDLRHFRHRPGEAIGRWRKEEVVPLYHRAGVEKFAYVLPEGAPAPPEDAPGKAEEGERFLTKAFSSVASARSWLSAP
jgi:hypothetical protein